MFLPFMIIWSCWYDDILKNMETLDKVIFCLNMWTDLPYIPIIIYHLEIVLNDRLLEFT